MNIPNEKALTYQRSLRRKTLYDYVLEGDAEQCIRWIRANGGAKPPLGRDPLRARKNAAFLLFGMVIEALSDFHFENIDPDKVVDFYAERIQDAPHIDAVRVVFEEMLITVCNMVRMADAPEDQYMFTCIDYIRTHLQSSITLQDIAACCGYNARYLSEKFKKMYGVSIKQYLIALRLETAARELRDTDKSIASIAVALNFSSQSHFQNQFKKEYDMTPKEYRVKMRPLPATKELP